jgi:uncharacterized tellurite resistance protein B-like protein
MELLIIILIIAFIIIVITAFSNQEIKSNGELSQSRPLVPRSFPLPPPNSQIAIPKAAVSSDCSTGFRIEISIGTNTVSALTNHEKIDISNYWIPKDTPIEVAGIRINGGMIYTGALDRKRQDTEIDPSFIDTNLEVNIQYPDRVGATMSYWPWYCSISPEARAAYLEWLSTGRRMPEAYIGYVFIFYYGLERRLFDDINSDENLKNEIEEILLEVKELLAVYGAKSGSFNSYATSFVQYITNKYLIDYSLVKYDVGKVNPSSWNMPLELQITLGQYAKSGEPLTWEWAMLWAEWNLPEQRSTVAKRCKKEVGQLFHIRYKNMYEGGLVLKVKKNSFITIVYQPASSLHREQQMYRIELPEVAQSSNYKNKVEKIYTSCLEDLDAYSRYIGRNPEKIDSVDAKALLPKELFSNSSDLINISYFAEQFQNQDSIQISCKDLLKYISYGRFEQLKKKDAVAIAQFLEKFDYGIIPDIRFDEPIIDTSGEVIVFIPSINRQIVSSKNYSLAVMILNLGTAISRSDQTMTDEEELFLLQYIEHHFDLSDYEKLRLTKYLRWLSTSELILTGNKNKIKDLSTEQRSKIAQFFVHLVCLDGIAHPEEVRILKKIYKIFSLEEDSVFSDIHKFQTTFSDGLASIISGDGNSRGYKIPPLTAESSHTIDDEAIINKIKDTEKVQAILAEIFNDPPNHDIDEKKIIKGILELDQNHSHVLLEIVKHERISAERFQILCEENDVLPIGAIETINNKSFEYYNDALIEENEKYFVINNDIAKEINLEQTI